ncbi:hypothetical protein ACTWPB_20520 [Nocardia sp. IBHARD005]|uniref:hypothetical protein n=1 Tax=Nocardia sp. IBHARD005 TaxID=3457765 RepID=UPI004057DFCC
MNHTPTTKSPGNPKAPRGFRSDENRSAVVGGLELAAAAVQDRPDLLLLLTNVGLWPCCYRRIHLVPEDQPCSRQVVLFRYTGRACGQSLKVSDTLVFHFIGHGILDNDERLLLGTQATTGKLDQQYQAWSVAGLQPIALAKGVRHQRRCLLRHPGIQLIKPE